MAAYLPSSMWVKEPSDCGELASRGCFVCIWVNWYACAWRLRRARKDVVAQIRHKKWVGPCETRPVTAGVMWGQRHGNSGGLPHLLWKAHVSMWPVNLPGSHREDAGTEWFRSIVLIWLRNASGNIDAVTQMTFLNPRPCNWGYFCVMWTELSRRKSALFQEKSNPDV